MAVAMTPPSTGHVTTSMLPDAAYVLSTTRHSGCTEPATTTLRRFVTRDAISAASAKAVAPSYIDALATSMPVSSQIIDWNS
jgi:hypothetical protein